MSVENKFLFGKDEINIYLKELAKELKREYGKSNLFEMIVVGGAAVACRYGFRQMTNDIDAYTPFSIKGAVHRVADRYGLTDGWLNTDFVQTDSYSPNLRLYSKYYKTFAGVLEVRTMADEYLVAMKLRAFRPYKHDLSDIVGIVNEVNATGRYITRADFEEAFHNLYGGQIPEMAAKFLERILAEKDLEQLYREFKNMESLNEERLLNANGKYTGEIAAGNVDRIIERQAGAEAENTEIVRKLKNELLQRYQEASWFRNLLVLGHGDLSDQNLEIILHVVASPTEIHIDCNSMSIWLTENGVEIEAGEWEILDKQVTVAAEQIRKDMENGVVLSSYKDVLEKMERDFGSDWN